MLRLTPQQIAAVASSGDTPPKLFDPNTRTTYVLLRKDTYDELAAGSQTGVQRVAAAIDWDRAQSALRPPQEWFDGDEPKPF